MVLVCPLVVLVWPLVVLVCPLVVSICSLVSLVVLSVGLFITDRLHGMFVFCIGVLLLTNQKKNVLISSRWEKIPTQRSKQKHIYALVMYTCNVFIDFFLLLFGYLLLFYVLMRTERKSNNNIFENNLSNCLVLITITPQFPQFWPLLNKTNTWHLLKNWPREI